MTWPDPSRRLLIMLRLRILTPVLRTPSVAEERLAYEVRPACEEGTLRVVNLLGPRRNHVAPPRSRHLAPLSEVTLRVDPNFGPYKYPARAAEEITHFFIPFSLYFLSLPP